MKGIPVQELRPGVRFALKNQAFEVTFVDANTMRYAPISGGRPHRMPSQTFWELMDSGAVGFLANEGGVPMLAPHEYSLCLLSDVQRDEMFMRYSFVKQALATRKNPLSRANLLRSIKNVIEQSEKQCVPPSRSTLARWIRRYVESDANITSLVPHDDKKGGRSKKFPLEVETVIARSIRDDYLTREQPTVKALHSNVIGRLLDENPNLNPKFLPSVRSIHRRVKELDPYITALKRHGKHYADANFRAAGASVETSRLMELVLIDGHRMDVLVVDPETGEVCGRPYLVCLFDVFTRTVVGWHISLLPFSATTALAAIKDMCSRDPAIGPGGIAESIVPDNGRDLVSSALRNLCMKIGMHIQGAKTYSPDDKAHLERFFRTLNEQLVHLIQGTTRSSPAKRGDYDSDGMACTSLDRLKSLFAQWLTEIYHRTIHSATGRAPSLSWRDHQSQMPILFFPIEDINVIARVCYKRQITKGRVIVDGLAYKSDALRTLEARHLRDVTVMVDELDLSYVYVQHESDTKTLYRADGVRVEYMKNLTKYEHDEVARRLKALTQSDLDELGPNSLEIARWKLWNEIHDLRNSKSARRLAVLTEGRGKRAVALEKIAPVQNYAAPSEVSLPMSFEHREQESQSSEGETPLSDVDINDDLGSQNTQSASIGATAEDEFDVFDN